MMQRESAKVEWSPLILLTAVANLAKRAGVISRKYLLVGPRYLEIYRYLQPSYLGLTFRPATPVAKHHFTP